MTHLQFVRRFVGRFRSQLIAPRRKNRIERNVTIARNGGNFWYFQLFGLRKEALRALDASAQWRTGEASVALPRGTEPLFQPSEGQI